LTQDTLPDNWQESFVSPIPKPNKSQTSVEERRPISVMDTCFAFIDRIIGRRLYEAGAQHAISRSQLAVVPNAPVAVQVGALMEFVSKQAADVAKPIPSIGDIATLPPHLRKQYEEQAALLPRPPVTGITRQNFNIR